MLGSFSFCYVQIVICERFGSTSTVNIIFQNLKNLKFNFFLKPKIRPLLITQEKDFQLLKPVFNVHLKELNCLQVGETSCLGVVLMEQGGSDSPYNYL